MRKQKKMICFGLMMLTTILLLAGCGNAQTGRAVTDEENIESQNPDAGANTAQNGSGEAADSGETEGVTELTVRFGDEGEPFSMHLYDNDTAAAIAAYVGQAAWRLPIYHYDDYDNWEIMQYYDIPSRYEIPESPEEVTAVKAGEVYYSEPNRIILFYHDGEISAEYTPVGYFDATDEFVTAVEENPVLEGWGNKIVQIEQ